jgi:hypothetical protein
MIVMPPLWRRVLGRIKRWVGGCASCGGTREVATCHLDDPNDRGGNMPCPECVDGRWVEDWNRVMEKRKSRKLAERARRKVI